MAEAMDHTKESAQGVTDSALGADPNAVQSQSGGTLFQRRRSNDRADFVSTPAMSETLNSAAFTAAPPPLSRKAQSLPKRIWYTFFAPPGTKFGTWDGVYFNCMTNVIGVILFLRMGYIAGNMGIWQSLVMIALVFLMSMVTILSTAGICNTCRLKKGGVYAIIKQALGTQIGGTVGTVYSLGLATVNAVFILGFAEAFCSMVGWDPQNVGTLRTIGIVAELIIVIIVLLGVDWVMKLNVFMLLILTAAILNVVIGAFVNPNFGQFTKYNVNPDYVAGENFFGELALLFATTTGIMAGANMSGDLKHPSTSIPVGTIAAIGTLNIIYVVFILVLASVALSSQSAAPDVSSPLGFLTTNYLIAENVAGSSAFFYVGLFVAGITSSFGVFTGAPRVLQGIGEDVHVFGIEQYKVTYGKKEEPLRALFFVATLTAGFTIIGEMNTVATIMTLILCMTYASINYAYFALATGGLREEARMKLLQEEQDARTMEVVQHLAQSRNQQDFRKPPRWVIAITNRWISLIMAIWHIVLMFFISWWMSLIVIGVFLFYYIYIGFLNRADNRLGDADFSLREWLNPLHHPSRKGTGHRARQAQMAAAVMSPMPGEGRNVPMAQMQTPPMMMEPLPTMVGAGPEDAAAIPTGDEFHLRGASPRPPQVPGEATGSMEDNIYAQAQREGYTPAQDEL